jgi:hypothetical protein
MKAAFCTPFAVSRSYSTTNTYINEQNNLRPLILDAICSYTNGLLADALGDVKPDYEDLRRRMKYEKNNSRLPAASDRHPCRHRVESSSRIAEMKPPPVVNSPQDVSSQSRRIEC